MMRAVLLSCCFLAPLVVTACASVSDTIPVVKVERKKPKRMVLAASYSPTEIDIIEAAQVCETDDMRTRVLDRANGNVFAKALVLEKGRNKPSVVGEATIDCRDYFLKKSMGIDTGTIKTINSAKANVQTSSHQIISTHNTNSSTIVTPKGAAQTRYINDKEPTPVVQVKTVTQPTSVLYRVEKGDNVYQIARENCTSVKRIAQLNKLRDATLIDVDQVLRLPANNCNR